MDPDRHLLMQMFQAESEEGLTAMEAGLLALEASPAPAEILDALFRGAHTLKGNAAALGFPALVDFAHVLEDLLERVRGRLVPVTPALCTLLLECVDALRSLLPAAMGGKEDLDPEHRRLMMRVSELAARVVGEAEPAHHAIESEADPESRVPRASAPNHRTLRVDVDRLDQMLDLVGEIAVSRGRLERALQDDGRGAALEAHGDLERLSADLQELVLRMRLVPLLPVFRQLDRTIRDAAATRGKTVRLSLDADGIEADTGLVDPLRNALTQIVRNAVDHGIELPERRRELGKEAHGTIRLCARQDGGSLVVELSDDGAGLPRARLLERARSQGLVREGDRLTDGEIEDLIFHPGLSTAEEVTEISGRGVGMDVVRHSIDALRGSIRVDSREGLGTTVTLRVPLTIAIVQGFAVRVGEETFVIPLEAVLECDELRPTDGIQAPGGGVLDLRGEAVPYLRLRHHFAVGGASPERESVVVVRDARLRAGLAVDALLGQSQAVVKPLGGPLRRVTGLAGATVRGDGRVALILDVPALLREAISQQAATGTCA
jgi:two-component system chemotaxis sensor kinase CheA